MGNVYPPPLGLLILEVSDGSGDPRLMPSLRWIGLRSFRFAIWQHFIKVAVLQRTVTSHLTSDRGRCPDRSNAGPERSLAGKEPKRYSAHNSSGSYDSNSFGGSGNQKLAIKPTR